MSAPIIDKRSVWLILCWLAGLLAGTPAAHAESVAFYYGDEVPEELLQVYERVVVEPDALRRSGARHADLAGRRARLLAYVSVGELARGMRPRSFDDEWVAGSNPAWRSEVMDLTHPGWRRYVLEERMAALWQQGYRGFFLDTLDSYTLAADTAESRAAQAAALVSLIQRMHRRFPGVELVANRGFEILPRVAPLLRGLVAESLYDRWDPSSRRYVPVPEADRRWLTGKLREARDRHGLPITVIDYRPPNERDSARRTARKIAELGFDPWVTNADLTMVGVGAPEVVPRRVLVLYDGAREPLERAAALRLLAPIVEHEGYVPVFRDVRDPLPDGPLPGRYAGVVAWLSGPLGRDAPRYCRWLVARLDEGMRVALFGQVGFDIPTAVLKRLGLARAKRASYDPASPHIAVQPSAMAGFEAAPMPHRILGPGLVARSGAPGLRVHLRVRDAQGPLRDPVLTGPWGGLALQPHILRQGYGGALSWVIDPFAFVREALALEPIPAPDVTTEYGHRLLMLHVDDRGVATPAETRGTPPAGRVVRKLVTAHGWPHSTTAPRLARGLQQVVLREHGLAGEGSSLTRANPSLTGLRAYARPVRESSLSSAGEARGAAPGAGGRAVSMPVAGPDSYRTAGIGAAYGFRRVIETFEITDTPRRLLPIAIQYSGRAAATAAGLKALEDIYAWVATQDTRPVYMGEYANKVRNFYAVVLARELDGRSWWLHGLAALRTVRLSPQMGWPDVDKSPAVVAVRDLTQGRYVSFAQSPRTRLVLVEHRPTKPIITGSNAEIVRFDIVSQRRGRLRLRLHARGHAPISVRISNVPMRQCALFHGRRRTRGRLVKNQTWQFRLSTNDTNVSVVNCRN